MYRKMTLAVAALAVALSMQMAFAGEKRPEGRPDGRRGPGDEICRPEGGWRGGRGHGPMGRHDRHPGKGFERGFGMGPGMMGFGHRFMDELELTDAQKTQLVDVITAKFREGLLVRMEMADAHKKVRELTTAETPDSAAIIAANEALGAARGKMEALGLTAKDEVKKVLTPEQVTKLEEMKSKRFADRDDDEDGPRPSRRFGPRHGMPGPGARMGGCW